MGDILCIYSRIGHYWWQCRHRSHNRRVNGFALYRRDYHSFLASCPYRYFAAYFFAVVVFFTVTQNKSRFLRWIYWTYDQHPLLHTWQPIRRCGVSIIKMITRLRKQPVCILTKTDEVRSLLADKGSKNMLRRIVRSIISCI